MNFIRERKHRIVCGAVVTFEALAMARLLTVHPFLIFIIIQIGVARGKNLRDKRTDIKERDLARETRREAKNFLN